MHLRQRFSAPNQTPKLIFSVTQQQLESMESVSYGSAVPPHIRVFENNQTSDVGISLSSSSAMAKKSYKILYNLNNGVSVFFTNNKYGDLNVISDSLSYDSERFRAQCVLLRDFHRALDQENIVWLRIPVHRVQYVQVSSEVGFVCHQVAFQRFFMMIFCKRHMLKDIDEHGTHNVGCSVVCWNADFSRLLFVQELNSRTWKLVSGSVHVHERYVECCIRETFEETGLHVRHLSTFAIHEATHFVQNKSKLHLFCVCSTNLSSVNPNSSMLYHNALDLPFCYLDPLQPPASGPDAIVVNPQELSAARWVSVPEFLDDELPVSTLDRHVVALMLLRTLRQWASDCPDAPFVFPADSLPLRLAQCDAPLVEAEHVALVRNTLAQTGAGQVLERCLAVVNRPENGARYQKQPRWVSPSRPPCPNATSVADLQINE